jgi:hypothetical protein
VSAIRRKQLIRDYKERKRPAGVYAVRRLATGQAWLDVTPDLDSRQNGVWFTLRRGGHPNRALQALWTADGEAGFAFEVIETVDDEGLSPLGLSLRLKDRLGWWRGRLGAEALTG